MPGRRDGGRGRGRGRGRGDAPSGKGGRGPRRERRNSNQSSASNASQSHHPPSGRKRVLLLHGNRQTGELLLGRLGKLQKALRQGLGLDIVAPDAPHMFSDDDPDQEDDGSGDATTGWQRTWWHRRGNTYSGLEESISMLDQIWNGDDREFVAIMGFSQGSRLTHLISMIHTITNGAAFPGLKCVLHFSGYGDVPMPDNFGATLNDEWIANIPSTTLAKSNEPGPQHSYNLDDIQIDLPSLHVMGETDRLIPLQSSEALLKSYVDPSVYRHPGSHFVPVKQMNVEKYLLFFEDALATGERGREDSKQNDTSPNDNTAEVPPDDEHAQAQIDEVAALAQIFPEEFRLLSKSTPKDHDAYDPDDYFEENRSYVHPIRYSIILQPQDGLDQIDESLWPPKNISLCIQYPAEYPDCSPILSLIHDMNYLEFSMQASEALLAACRKAMEEEMGMPCIMGTVYAAREFFECANTATTKAQSTADSSVAATSEEETATEALSSLRTPVLLRPSTAARNKQCTAQGLEVACSLLRRAQPDDVREKAAEQTLSGGKGGRWHYTVGLVGKPSAGKSTFFNVATAFARQRGEEGGEARSEDDVDAAFLGGASMAPHPFTTIDPNVGYGLIPAPKGTCPEDDEDGLAKLTQSGLALGSTHGRDSKGRRMLPVCMKDVAGLVPGAYQGRGRGNKFLDDLTDADSLIHIVDASGSSDAEGNKVSSDGTDESDLNDPIDDLEWVRNELVEWVYYNVSSKWESVVRRGKDKLIGMFSGYKQSQSFTQDVMAAVEKYVAKKEGRVNIVDDLGSWDEGDLHRLVSAFLGARFPMALALNKSDIPSAAKYIVDIESKLPIHGAHVAVGLSAHEEMKFIRRHLLLANGSPTTNEGVEPMGGKVWDCLQAAVSLREPTLIFPVNDMETYEPLPGMAATRDSSLPSHGFISALEATGGSAPSQWVSSKKRYIPSTKSDAKPALRDCIMMRPRSTVEDVFTSLKNLGVLEGEFVRAEGSQRIGEAARPVSKTELVGIHNRILRIMTTKRKEWQKKL